MSAIGYYNGAVGPVDSIRIPINDRAVYFGDGCYEACMAVNGRPFCEQAHFDRFYHSLEALRIPFAMPRERLKGEIDRCLALSGERSASLYWQVSRGTDRRHHTFPDAAVQPNLLITVTPKTPDLDGAPMRLITMPDVRFELCDTKTLNLIPNILAIQTAKEAGADEAAFVRNGIVTEGSHTNIAILRDGVLYTHPLDRHILAGVTRDVLLEICRAQGIPVSETAFSAEQMRDADEIFVSSSLLGIHSVSTIDGVAVGGRAAAQVRAIVEAYRTVFSEETGA